MSRIRVDARDQAGIASSRTVDITVGSPPPTPTAFAGIGGNYVNWSEPNTLFDTQGQICKDELRAAIVRIFLVVHDWVTGEPSVGGYSIDAQLRAAKALQDQGARICVGMAGFGGQGTNDNAFADKLGDYLLHARNQHGVRVEYIGINENEWGISGDGLADFMLRSGQRWVARGITTKWFLGDHAEATANEVFIRPMLTRINELRAFVGPIAFHFYDPPDPGRLSGTMAQAHQHGLDVWCTEILGARHLADDSPERAADVENRYRIMINAGVKGVVHWAHMVRYGPPAPSGGTNMLVSPSGQRYPTFTTLKHLAQEFPPR